MSDANVIIDWEGPFLSKEIKDENEGLYQFYGFHPVYGSYVLLYIGKALDFKKEIREHETSDYLSDSVPKCLRSNPMHIYLGYVQEKHDIELIDIERLLVFSHSPAWNFDHIRNSPGDTFNISNRGKRAALLHEVKGADYI